MLRGITDARVITRVILYGLAVVLLVRFTPWFVYVPCTLLIVAVHTLVERRVKWRRYRSLLQSIQHTQSALLPDVAQVREHDPDRLMHKFFKELVAEVERKNFQLVEKNIQLLSIKEIGLTLVSSLDESKVVDAVVNFLSKGLGYRELFIGIYHDDWQGFNFHTFRDTAAGNTFEQTRLELGQLNGLLKKAVQMHQPLLIRDPEMHQIGVVNGRPIFPDSTMNSYVIVPLVKSTATQDCGFKQDCILRMNQVQKEKLERDDAYTCPACGRIPVLGVLGVTDGFKAASLSKVDLVSVETLAVQLSTMLENTRLFQELKHEESFRENVINSMINGLITIDIDGRIKLANEPAVQLSGYTHDELIGMSVGYLISDTVAEGNGNPVLRTLHTGRRTFQQEAWLNKKAGGVDPIILNTTFLHDESRRIQGVLAVFTDTARIKRMEEQIAHLDKLAALGRLSSSIAHEIRNPLTGIAAGIQYLKRAGQIAESEVENIDFILQEVSRIDRLIGDLMNVVRVGDLIYGDADMEALVRNGVASMQELAKKRTVTMKMVFPETRRTVSVDADRITQVIINLLKNAIEASHPGGEVVVTVRYLSAVSDVLFDAIQDFVIIEVRDYGLGFKEEDKNRVFEPFFSTKSSGTGLGLYVTHGIVQQHGGYIHVDSQYGSGSAFTVYLPATQVRHGDTSKIGHPAGR